MHIRVETRANAVGDPEPTRFNMGPRHLEVVSVLDRWLHPEYGYFKVAADDGATYILRHDISGAWEITLYESGRRPPAPALAEVKRPQ